MEPPGKSKVSENSYDQQLPIRTYVFDPNGRIPYKFASAIISPDTVQLCVQLTDPDQSEDKDPTQILQYCFSSDELKHICDGPSFETFLDFKLLAVPSYLFE